MTYAEQIAEQKAYYALCDKARALGIPTSLDDPRTTRTVAGLEAVVAVAEARRVIVGAATLTNLDLDIIMAALEVAYSDGGEMSPFNPDDVNETIARIATAQDEARSW